MRVTGQAASAAFVSFASSPFPVTMYFPFVIESYSSGILCH